MLNSWTEEINQRQSKRQSLNSPGYPTKYTKEIPLKEDPTPDLKDSAKKEAKKEGQEELIKDQVKQEAQNEQKLNQVVDNSNTVLFSAKTVFPFTFFPDEVIVSLNDISVVYNEFFFSNQIHSFSISRVGESVVTNSLLFSQLKLIDKYTYKVIATVDYLPKKEAIKIQKLVQGLVAATNENIDLTKVESENLASKIEELGTVHADSVEV